MILACGLSVYFVEERLIKFHSCGTSCYVSYAAHPPTFMPLGHPVRLGGDVLEMRMIVDEKVLLLFEEVVDVFDGRREYELVACLAERRHEPTENLSLVLPAHAQVLVVLEEHSVVVVGAEHGVVRQPLEEHLVHRHGLLERRQVLTGDRTTWRK